MIRRFFSWVLLMAAGIAAAGCGKSEKSGQEYADEILARFNDRILNCPDFGMKSENPRIYTQGIESAEAARRDCATWIYAELEGDTYEFVLPDGQGTVRVDPLEEDGDYYQVSFDLRGHVRFMLHYMSPSKAQEDNVFPRDWPRGQVVL